MIGRMRPPGIDLQDKPDKGPPASGRQARGENAAPPREQGPGPRRRDAHSAGALELRGSQALREAARQLERLARLMHRQEVERGLALAGLAHDMRLPLARIRLEAEMSVADPQALALIAADIEEIDVLADALATRTRESERAPSTKVHEALEQVAAPFRRARRLEFDNLVEPHWQVLAEPRALRRALRNLMDNAVRHGASPHDGLSRVQAQARAVGTELCITLRDHGPGVPEDEWPRLAQPYFRGSRAGSSANGSGLGLWIVRQTLQAMGGSLRLGAAPGGGLQAELRLPLAEAT